MDQTGILPFFMTLNYSDQNIFRTTEEELTMNMYSYIQSWEYDLDTKVKEYTGIYLLRPCTIEDFKGKEKVFNRYQKW